MYGEAHEDTVFGEAELQELALALITDEVKNGDAKVTVAKEYQRKEELGRYPLNQTNKSYGSDTDEIIVTLEVRIWYMSSAREPIVTKVNEILAERQTEREAVVEQERLNKIADLQAQIEALQK